MCYNFVYDRREYNMDINQILLFVIVVLSSIIAIFLVYFLIIFLMNRKREKKVKTIFDPSTLVEEESLMNVLDDKKNIEFKNPAPQENFVSNAQQVNVVTSQVISQEQKSNPFGVDMTKHNRNDVPVDIPEQPNSQNKFIQ